MLRIYRNNTNMSATKRQFTMEDQINFAAFSGDVNPIHLDIIESRKTHAGEPIVHGVHLALWALDVLEIDLKIDDRLEVKFISQVELYKEVKVIWDDKAQKIRVISSNFEHCSIKIENSESNSTGKPKSNLVKFNNAFLQPNITTLDQVVLDKKILDLCGGNERARGVELFPFLVSSFGLDLIYEVACLSSVVGMKIPGKFSLFSGLSLNLSPVGKVQSVTVKKKHNVLGMVSIDYTGVNISASIRAFFRPKSSPVTEIKHLLSKVSIEASLKNKRVLVIGGSRGLGAYLAKINAVMGAEVTFTYNLGKADAKEIATDIKKSGSIVFYKQFDIQNKSHLSHIDGAFDMVYYLATPKIRSNKSLEFDVNLYELYRSFYVDGFQRIVESFFGNITIPKFLFPSTSFIDGDKGGYKEYIKAKVDGEVVCQAYQKDLGINICHPRIPPLDTDQNLSLISTKNSDTAEQALSLIHMMNHSVD